MEDEVILNKNIKATLFAKIKKAILLWLRLTNIPVVKVYHGYGNAEKIVVLGHVFSLSPLSRNRYRSGFGRNIFSFQTVVTVAYLTGTTRKDRNNAKTFRPKPDLYLFLGNGLRLNTCPNTTIF